MRHRACLRGSIQLKPMKKSFTAVLTSKFNTFLTVSIVLVFVALITTTSNIILFLLSEQNLPNPNEKHTSVFSTPLEASLLTYYYQTTQHSFQSPNRSSEVKDTTSQHMILVLDFWERMINVQSGLRRLVQLGIDSGFTVIEPFVYESKVSEKYSFPEHFEAKNMTPQTAASYFETKDLYLTKRYISQEEFRKRTRIIQKGQPQFLVQSAIYFDWSSPCNKPFRWCDHRLRHRRKTKHGFLLSQNTHVQRAICLSASCTTHPATFTATLFHDLFSLARNGSTAQGCPNCTTLAFMNYRKHAFNGFVAHTGARPFRQKAPPLHVGKMPQDLARRVRNELMRNRPYVAIQMRTGKAFTLLEHYEAKLHSENVPFIRHEAFRQWLQTCTRELVRHARVAARQLKTRSVFYIASDMYNDGWKGGEKCPEDVKTALETAKQYLNRELKRVVWFHPGGFGVKQDRMGVAGLTDAAVCLQAERFVYAMPSNFGRWVHEQRKGRGVGDTTKVDCMDERFVGN